MQKGYTSGRGAKNRQIFCQFFRNNERFSEWWAGAFMVERRLQKFSKLLKSGQKHALSTLLIGLR
jgi:hypothetical protein